MLRFNGHPYYTVVVVEVLVKEILQFPVSPVHVFAEANHVIGQFLEVFDSPDPAAADHLVYGLDQVVDFNPDQAADQAMPGQIVQNIRAAATNTLVDDLPERHPGKLFGCDHP